MALAFPKNEFCGSPHNLRFFAKHFQSNASNLGAPLDDAAALEISGALAKEEGSQNSIPCRKADLNSTDGASQKVVETFVRRKFPKFSKPEILARALFYTYDSSIRVPPPPKQEKVGTVNAVSFSQAQDGTLYYISQNQVAVQPPKGEAYFIPSPAGIRDAKAQSVLVASDELFAIFGSGDNTTLFHYKLADKSWEKFSFNAFATSLHPTYLEEISGFLVVTSDNGSMMDTKIAPRGMVFVPHPSKLDAMTSIRNVLRKISVTEFSNNTEPLGFISPQVVKEQWFPSAIDSYWKKRCAAEFLDERLKNCYDPAEFKKMDNMRQQLLAALTDDKVVFLIRQTDEGAVLERKEYYEYAFAYTHRMSLFTPDEIVISRKQWDYVTEPLKNDAGSAEAERAAIAESARRWKMVVGSQNGIALDFGGWPGNLMPLSSLVPFLGPHTGQTTCSFDFYNTFSLLTKLGQGGFLHYHVQPQYVELSKTYQALGHVAGKLYDKTSDKWFVVDTWPMGAGHMPNIVPIENYSELNEISFNIAPTAASYFESPTLNRFFHSAFFLALGARYARNWSRNFAATGTLRYPNYFVTPKGVFNFGWLAMSAYGLLTLPNSQWSPDGIPDETKDNGPEFLTLFTEFASLGYASAEARLALARGTTPLLYEAPFLGFASVGSYYLTSGGLDLVGRATETKELCLNSGVNEGLSSVVSAIGAYLAAKFAPENIKLMFSQGTKHLLEDVIGPRLYNIELSITSALAGLGIGTVELLPLLIIPVEQLQQSDFERHLAQKGIQTT